MMFIEGRLAANEKKTKRGKKSKATPKPPKKAQNFPSRASKKFQMIDEVVLAVNRRGVVVTAAS
jgi:hypothetical protein